MQEKQRCMILFFQFFNHFLCRFASRYCQKCLLSEKHCNYPLITTQSDRFTSYENIVSRSHTSSLTSYPPPPPLPSPPPPRYTWMYLVWIVSLFRKSRGLKISFKCKLCVILGVPEDWPFQLSVWLACYCCHGWHYVHKKPPFLWSVFNHVASIYANLLEQKKAFA